MGGNRGCGFFEPDTGHLRIIDRAKDVGKMADGSMFAPKYVENKLKFYPNILEAVVFGAGAKNAWPLSTLICRLWATGPA